MLKLKLLYFGHLMWRTDSFEKTLMLGEIEGRRRRGRQRMRWLDGILTQWTWVWVNCGNWWGTGKPGVLQSMGSQRVRHNWETELNWSWGVIFFPYTFCWEFLSRTDVQFHQMHQIKKDHMIFIFHFLNVVYHTNLSTSYIYMLYIYPLHLTFYVSDVTTYLFFNCVSIQHCCSYSYFNTFVFWPLF